jgi:serine/threonine protein kinase
LSHPPDDLFAALQAALHPQYRVERELGRGGMGIVYEATDRTLERRVAIKVAHPELVDRQAIAQRFLAEARMLARIRHPNIVAVHQAGRVNNLLYYVMDHVPGESLRQLLNREGALPIDRARAIVQDLADALDAAGRAGFVHRDVKPENGTRAADRFRHRSDLGRRSSRGNDDRAGNCGRDADVHEPRTGGGRTGGSPL